MNAWLRARTAALIVALTSPAAAWTVRPEKAISAGPIAVDAASDVFAALSVNAPYRGSRGFAAAVVKLSHADGTQLWRRRLRAGGSERSDFIYDLRVASNGDAVAAGSLVDHGHSVFFVARLAGRDGRQLWRSVVRGRETPSYGERAEAIAVDASGDVVAAGAIESAMSAQYHHTNDFAAVKFAGETGDVRWRFQLNGSADHFDSANAVAVDGNGDVVVIGSVTEISPDPFAIFGNTVSTVMKLARDDGRLLWRRDRDQSAGILGTLGRSVVVDTNGDVLIAGNSLEGAGNTFAVTKMAGTTGESLWTTAVSGGGGIGYRPFQVFRVGVLPSGDVAAVGLSADANQVPSMTAVRLDAESGAERWRQDLRGSDGYGVGRALAIGGDGSLLVGGQLRNRRSCYDATVMRLDPDAGTVVRQRMFDGTATASQCDAGGCGGEHPGPDPCGPPRAGIDQDDVIGLTVDAQGGIAVAGVVSESPRGRRQGFVALVR